MNSARISYLISLYLDGSLSPEEKQELENALRSSSAARAQFWSETKIHDQLRIVEQAAAVLETPKAAVSEGLRVLPPPVSRGKISWLLRPLTAAAAGIVLSALCTSAVWAYAGQRHAAKLRSLPIANPSFESPEQMPPNGVPEIAGKWSGDFAKVVGAENGVQPHNGKQMLRFVNAANSMAKADSLNYVGEAIQVVDLRLYRGELSTGAAQIEITGWFASLPSEAQQYNFLIKAATFVGETIDAPFMWEDIAHSSLSLVQNQIHAEPGQWQALTVSLPAPATADFMVFECGVLRRAPRPTQGTVEFPGHYVDDLRLQLRITNQNSLPLSTIR
ncbi:MAG: zf-HC2 domain-containing protein [Verrucomicrobiota bacterium]